MTQSSNLRIHLVFLLLGQLFGVQALHIVLKMPKYVEKGHSATLRCEFDLSLDQIYKIEYLKSGKKIFQFVRERSVPYKNFTIKGATLDWKHSNEKQIRLKGVEFAASGPYSCLVSMETPIFTKTSDPVELTVFERQAGDPEIKLRKASYAVGDVLELNCTSQPARPPPAVTWLLNGKQVDYTYLKTFQHGRHHHGEHLSASTTQLTLDIMETHVGPSGFVELTCISTIPAYLDDEGETFADKRVQTISVEVHQVKPTASETSEGLSSSNSLHPTHFLLFLLLAISSATAFG